jgi:hypothetical protein
MSAAQLLAQARSLYDDPALPYAPQAAQAWRSGFASGAEWMRMALSTLRGEVLPARPVSYNALGIVKYTLASLGALLYLIIVVGAGLRFLAPGLVFVFYAIEAQMVFLFPLTIDGLGSTIATSQRWTRKAGGTLKVMLIVMQLAVVMLFGGVVGQGFVRSWALGCLAVVLWYEEVRLAAQVQPEVQLAANRLA